MSSGLIYLEKSLSVGSLDAYIHWVNKIPLLTEKEELDLANRLRAANDLEAARRLILSHLRVVVKIARGYSGYGLQQADLIQEGNIGLMKAVKRFDPSVGVRLVSFAIHWIRAEIHEFILKNWRIVKIATTKAQRKLFFNLRKAAKKIGWLSDNEVAMVAEELNVSQRDVRLMELRLNSHDQSFDQNTDDDDGGSSGGNAAGASAWYAPANYLQSQQNNPANLLEHQDWSSNQVQQLSTALTALDKRSQEIISFRWLNAKKSTLQELAEKYQVSAERIRQLEKNAMKKLQAAITRNR